jgi:hypothetical protein
MKVRVTVAAMKGVFCRLIQTSKQMSQPEIRIAIGTEDGAQKYFVVSGTGVVSSHSTAAEAIAARGKLIVERLQSGSGTGRGIAG